MLDNEYEKKKCKKCYNSINYIDWIRQTCKPPKETIHKCPKGTENGEKGTPERTLAMRAFHRSGYKNA